jgi:large subunit ribosomal protein L10
MTKAEKDAFINELSEQLTGVNVFYLADTSALDAEATTALRRNCFKANVSLQVVKNTLLEKALAKIDGVDYGDLPSVLAGPTSLMIAEAGNAPAKVIKEFRKKYDKPILKGAFVEESIYIGEENLDALVAIKSKNELIGELITLLQSPAKNVISALKAPAGNLSGILKALEERAEA